MNESPSSNLDSDIEATSEDAKDAFLDLLPKQEAGTESFSYRVKHTPEGGKATTTCATCHDTGDGYTPENVCPECGAYVVQWTATNVTDKAPRVLVPHPGGPSRRQRREDERRFNKVRSKFSKREAERAAEAQRLARRANASSGWSGDPLRAVRESVDG